MRIFVVLLLLIAWYFFSWTYVDLRKNSCCDQGANLNEGLSTSPTTHPALIDTILEDPLLHDSLVSGIDVLPVGFRWSDATPVFGPDFTSWRDSLINGIPDGGRLQITGWQYRNELTRGLARERAIALQQVMGDLMDPAQIDLKTKRVDQTVPSREDPFEAISVAVTDSNEADEVQAENSTVYFDWGTTQGQLSSETQAYLGVLAEQVIATGSVVVLTGHTDNTSSSDFNLRLGARRANAIRAVLIQQGVDPRQIRVRSKGETEPVASNDTEEGRRENRRVDIEILPQ